jgi:hypothetical protein
MNRPLTLLSVFLAACAHTPEPEPSPVRPPPLCSTVPSIAATRLPKPASRPCSERGALRRACEAADPVACYQLGYCLSADILDSRFTPEERAQLVDAAKTALGVSCKAGISEGCVLRGGVRLLSGTPEAELCDDVVRACQLGDEVDGCIACFKSSCK